VSHPVDNALLDLDSHRMSLVDNSSRYRFWVQFGILAAVVAALYYKVVFKLVFDWWNDPNFSHGFFVPLFAGFVLWQSRKKIESAPVKPSWFGLVVILGSLALLIVGVLGSELFLSRTSLVFLLGGIIIYFCGWDWFRLMLFPWAVLFLMIPIPAIVFNNIALPLQFLASKLATGMLSAVGVPVWRDGNVITLPAMKLEVVEACSGIRSLVSLLTLAVIYGYFADARILRRVLLILAAIPVAVLANGVRIMGTGLLGQYWDPDKAQGFFHEFSGWVIFLLAMAMLFLVHRILVMATPRRAGAVS
jgi:exosortase